MGAIRRGKIYARERTRLETVIPLELPFSIQIDICSVCNLKCNFCFHSDDEAIRKSGLKMGVMSYDVFTKIIDDLKEMCTKEKKIKKLRLFKSGEPLLNPKVCEMIAYAKKAEIAECIELTTNGILLGEKMNLGLIEAGLDILNISINGISEKQYKEVCQCNLNFDDFRKNIAHFYENRGTCKLFLKYSDIGYSTEEKDNFYAIFDSVCDEIFVETIQATYWQDTNVGDNIVNAHKGTYGQALKNKQVCPFLFTTMVIEDHGIAHLCCVDWKTEYILGDLKKEKVSEVWNGEKLKEYQRIHLMKQKDCIPLCRNCEMLSAQTIDDIDDYAEEILEKYYTDCDENDF